MNELDMDFYDFLGMEYSRVNRCTPSQRGFIKNHIAYTDLDILEVYQLTFKEASKRIDNIIKAKEDMTPTMEQYILYTDDK